MYCFKCGSQNDDSAFKCNRCGTIIQRAANQRVVVKKNSTAVTILVIVGIIFGLIAVTGILAAIALPAYMDYTRKAKLAEVINLTGAVKTALIEKASEPGVLESEGPGVNAPDSEAVGKTLGISVSSKFVSNMSAFCNSGKNCAVIAIIKGVGSPLDGQAMIFSTVNEAPDLSQWDWSKSTVPPKYLPR